MKKQEAMKCLQEMQAEMDKLKAIIEKPDTPEVFQGRYLREGLGNDHWWVGGDGNVLSVATPSSHCRVTAGNCFATAGAAKQYAEHLRLMQEARVAMAADWGDEKPDWASLGSRYVIVVINNEVVSRNYISTYSTLHFRTCKARDEFMAKYTQEQLKLMIMGVQ